MLGASSPKSRRAGVDGGTIFRGLPRRPMRLPLVACAPEPGCPCFSNPPRCVCRGFSPPSKSQTPATNADFFRPSVPNPPKAILLFPNKNFPIFPGDQVLSQAPDAPSTRIAEFDKETTRRRNSPRLGFYLQRVASARRLFSPDRGSLPKHAAPGTEQHCTSPHLTFPLPRLTSSTTGACPAHQRRSSCDDPGTASSAPPPPAPSQRQSDYRISYSALGLTAIPRSRQHSTTSADNHIRPLPNKIFVRSTPKKSTKKKKHSSFQRSQTGHLFPPTPSFAPQPLLLRSLLQVSCHPNKSTPAQRALFPLSHSRPCQPTRLNPRLLTLRSAVASHPAVHRAPHVPCAPPKGFALRSAGICRSLPRLENPCAPLWRVKETLQWRTNTKSTSTRSSIVSWRCGAAGRASRSSFSRPRSVTCAPRLAKSSSLSPSCWSSRLPSRLATLNRAVNPC